jgi:sulfite dehydrogenase (cytochrome) subunit B
MRSLTIALLASAIALPTFAMPAFADESRIRLKDAPGRDKVEGNCAACHSLDYIQMNSPFMNAATWDAEVTKMIKALGAPISDDDAKAIKEYLIHNYGG